MLSVFSFGFFNTGPETRTPRVAIDENHSPEGPRQLRSLSVPFYVIDQITFGICELNVSRETYSSLKRFAIANLSEHIVFQRFDVVWSTRRERLNFVRNRDFFFFHSPTVLFEATVMRWNSRKYSDWIVAVYYHAKPMRPVEGP